MSNVQVTLLSTVTKHQLIIVSMLGSSSYTGIKCFHVAGYLSPGPRNLLSKMSQLYNGKLFLLQGRNISNFVFNEEMEVWLKMFQQQNCRAPHALSTKLREFSKPGSWDREGHHGTTALFDKFF